jgi:ech hydrogenase subunit C
MTFVKKSPWVSFINCGGCNGCTLECVACFNPRYDVTRFGIELKPSAKHADVLLVTGIVNKHIKKRLLNIYEQMADPKVVIAVGACAVSNGLYKDSYNTAGPLDKVLKVDSYVPGCPPRPEAVIDALLLALDIPKKSKKGEVQK